MLLSSPVLHPPEKRQPDHNDGMTGLPRATRLIDRRSEMAELEAERRRASAGEFRTVLMLADPGMGKSRIAKEFLARNRFRSLALSARAHPLGETASFGVWAEALERHLRGRDAGSISELCEGFLDDLAVLVRS